MEAQLEYVYTMHTHFCMLGPNLYAQLDAILIFFFCIGDQSEVY